MPFPRIQCRSRLADLVDERTSTHVSVPEHCANGANGVGFIALPRVPKPTAVSAFSASRAADGGNANSSMIRLLRKQPSMDGASPRGSEMEAEVGIEPA